MTISVMDLVRGQLDLRLEDALRSAILARLGAWLGVFQEEMPWSPPYGILQYDGVAEAAIVYACSGDVGAQKYFIDGLVWLQKRRFFVPGQPKGLDGDPLACLSIAVGVIACKNESARSWLAGFVERAIGEEQSPGQRDLFHLAAAVVKQDEVAWLRLSPVLAVACGHKLRRQLNAEQVKVALETVVSMDGLDAEWAIFYASALRKIFSMEGVIDVAQPTIAQVGKLLRGIPAALKRWPWEGKEKAQSRGVTAQRWDIQNEYHVQSLIWAVLRPVFPGLEDEENLPSLGQKHPRADLLIPTLRLVIEVKFLRKATQAARAKVIEEIAADTAIYRTPNSGYDVIIAFIWDATRSNQHHAELEAGISKLEGIVDVVIVSRPGDWEP